MHTILENDNMSVCKSFSEQSSLHLSKSEVYQAPQNIKEKATNSQQSLRSLATDSLVGNWYSFNEGRNYGKKKSVRVNHGNESTSKK